MVDVMMRWVQGFLTAGCIAVLIWLVSQQDRSRSLEEGSIEQEIVLEVFEEILEPEEKAPDVKKELILKAKTLEMREARQSIRVLFEENKSFRKEVLDLREQIRRLAHSSAQERVENDQLHLQIRELEEGQRSGKLVADSIDTSFKVIDVNEDLGLVVLDQGSAAGIRNRMRFAVLRGGKQLAVLEAVNVRERITGAAIKEIKQGEIIVEGDRVILWK